MQQCYSMFIRGKTPHPRDVSVQTSVLHHLFQGDHSCFSANASRMPFLGRFAKFLMKSIGTPIWRLQNRHMLSTLLKPHSARSTFEHPGVDSVPHNSRWTYSRFSDKNASAFSSEEHCIATFELLGSDKNSRAVNPVTTPKLPVVVSRPEEWCVTYALLLIAHNTASPLTMTWTDGLLLVKTPKLSS